MPRSNNISTDELDRRYPSQAKMVTSLVIAVICGIIFLIFLFGSWYTIPAGYRGIVLTFSKPADMAVGEGLHFKVPIIQSVIKIDTRTQKYEADLTAASQDLQDVNTKIAINYHLSPDSVVDVYRTVGVNYAEKLIYPLEQESNKAATAKFVAGELITKREDVRNSMETLLREKLGPRGIFVESISIIDFKFSPSFSQAIENKVTMEQNALAAKNKLEQIKYEANQRVAQAQGEADAIRIQTQAISINGGQSYLTLKWIERWNGQVSMVNGGDSIVDLRGVDPAGYLAVTPSQNNTINP